MQDGNGGVIIINNHNNNNNEKIRKILKDEQINIHNNNGGIELPLTSEEISISINFLFFL